MKKLVTLVVYGLLILGVQLPLSALAYDTWAVSEEDPPAACDIGDAIYGITCYGGYCDNTRLSCTHTNYPVYSRGWTTNFSEEGTNYRLCGVQQIMSGVSCSGGYCDNLSIECSQIDRVRYNCQWVGPYSEEQGFAYFGGKYANGVWCSGSYCDNRWYYVCNY